MPTDETRDATAVPSATALDAPGQVTPSVTPAPTRTPRDRPVAWTLPFLLVMVVSVSLVALSYWMPSLGEPIFQRDGAIGNWFNVDEESNLPTWWSTLLLGGAGIMHLWGLWVARRTHSRGVIAWCLVALMLLALSVDEASQLHESLDGLEGVIETPVDFGRFWLVFGIPAAIGLLVLVLVSGIRLPLRTLVAQVLGLGFLFAGAVGMEVIGSSLYEQGLEGSAQETLAYHVEELLEMTGAGLLFVAPLIGLRLVANTPMALALAPSIWVSRRPRSNRVAGR